MAGSPAPCLLTLSPEPGAGGGEDQLIPSDICPLESWAGAPPPLILSGMSLPASPPLHLQGRGNGWADERVAESVRKRCLPAIRRPLDLDWAGGGISATCPPGIHGALSFHVGEGWCVTFSEKIYAFVSLAKLGWGFISMSVPGEERVNLSFLQGLSLCSSGWCVSVCCSLGQRILCDSPC